MSAAEIRHPRAGRTLTADAHHVRDLIWSALFVDGDIEVLGKTEESIAKEYGVSRNAVRLGLAMLANEGVLTRRRGIGTSVAVDPINRTAGESGGISDAVDDGDRRVRRMTLTKTIIPSSPLLRARFGEQPGGFLRWERTTYVDELPYGTWTSYLPLVWAAPLLTDDGYDSHDMLKLVAALAPTQPVRTMRRLQAISADERTSIHLGIEPGVPVMHLERTIEDADGHCLELGFADFRSDRYTLSYATQHVTAADG